MSPTNQIRASEATINASEVKNHDSQLSFNIEIELNSLSELILSSTRVPLTELAIIDRDLVLDRLEQIKQNMPIDLATAIEIANCKQQIISDAEGYASLVIKSAEERACNMLQDSEIVRQAELNGAQIRLKIERECQELMQATQSKAAQLKNNAIAEFQAIQTGADDYADSVLDDMEQRLQQMLEIVQNGRQQLDRVD